MMRGWVAEMVVVWGGVGVVVANAPMLGVCLGL